ncbi:hypothetical protein ACFL2U_02635 [Patescibacteria group bacterium]
MPNQHGQVTEQDMKAPQGMIRLIMENMDDGELEIIADFHQGHKPQLVIEYAEILQGYSDHIYTLWDDQGNNLL